MTPPARRPATAASAPEEAARRPKDPRAAPDVLAALGLAARGDPHPDPVLPVGRAALLVWLVILAGLAYAQFGELETLPGADHIKGFTSAVHDIAGDERSRRHALKEFENSPHQFEITVVLGLIAGSAAFALYYTLVYLIGLPTLRRLVWLSVLIYRRALRPAAHFVVRKGRQSLTRFRNKRTTAAGQAPQFD